MIQKSELIRIADAIRVYNEAAHTTPGVAPFKPEHLTALSHVFATLNPRFNRDHWRSYVLGVCGPNGGRR